MSGLPDAKEAKGGGKPRSKPRQQPAKPRKRNVTTALRAYAALTTSAARGAVRDVDQLNRRG